MVATIASVLVLRKSKQSKSKSAPGLLRYVYIDDVSAFDAWTVLNVRLLTVQNKESTSQFSNPLYLPPGKKSAAYQGTIAINRE